MESPSRRAPPPPSNPPPRNISRSGRVPPPKGAPPGCVRYARKSGRRPLDPDALSESRGIRGADIGQSDDDQDLGRRRGHVRRTPRPDKGHRTDESSQESFDQESVLSDHGREHHPFPAVRTRRRHRSVGDGITSPRNRSEESIEERSTSQREGRGMQDPSRREVASQDRSSSRSDASSWSSDGNVSRGSPEQNRGTIGGDDKARRERGRERQDRNRDRQHQRRMRRDQRSSDGSDDGQNDTISHTGSAEDSEEWREGSQEQHLQPKHAENAPMAKLQDHAEKRRFGPERNSSFLDDSAKDDVRESDPLEDCESQSRTIDCGKNLERRRSKSGETPKTKPRRRRKRAEQDDSEAEGYGWSGNRYSWDSADATSTGSRPSQDGSRNTTPSSAEEGPYRKRIPHSSDDDRLSDDDDPGASRLAGGDGVAAADKQSRSSTSGYGSAEVADASKTQENKQEQPDARSGDQMHVDTGSGHVARQSPQIQDARSLPANAASRASVNVGKPIRGARWGEAIGVRSRVFDTSTIPTKIVQLKTFLSCPLQSGPGTVLRCFIERDRSGTHKFSHVFSMYADLEDGSGRMLLAARKLLASKTAYYIICIRQDELFRDSGKRGGNSFLAKLRASSVAHTEYALYDRGDNPAVAPTETRNDSTAEAKRKSVRNPLELARSTAMRQHEKHAQGEFRRELGVIVYNFDKKEQRTGKRRMEVAIPQLQGGGDSWEPVSWQPSDTKESMISNFGRVRYQGAQNFLQDDRLLIYHQRESRYDPLSSCLVDYRGRATAPSVKNFQLLKSPPEDNVKRAKYFSERAKKGDDIDSDDLPRPVYLQMGKVGKDCFNVDLEWPMSILQGFAICLSRFDTQAQF